MLLNRPLGRNHHYVFQLRESPIPFHNARRKLFKNMSLEIEAPKVVSIAELLLRLQKEMLARSAPDEYRLFFSEIAKNSPACGLL